MYIWWMDESEHSSILKKNEKKTNVRSFNGTYNMKELDDAGIRKLIKDWMKEEK